MKLSLAGNSIVIGGNEGGKFEVPFLLEGSKATLELPIHVLQIVDFVGVREIIQLLKEGRGIEHVFVRFD